MSFANNLIVARDARKPEALEVRYQIERELGAGSGSTVYQALRLPSQEDAAADESRRVALKISTSPRWKGRLTDEAAILKKLSENQRNRRVVHIGAEGRVLQAQSALGDIWMIELEYLEGQTLRDWFDHHWTKAQPSPEQVMDEILELATQLAEGLVELEGPAGSGDQILHRDLKPENLMRTPQGLRLFDFNVSKERTESQFTEVGTRGYQAPEVSGARYDHRIDFWSLGVILWEVLHQRRFDLLVATREHQGEYQLRWPTQRSQSLPKPMEGALGALLGRLLAPVGARFETAQLLLEEIQLLRQQQGTSLRNAVVGFDMIQLLAQLSPSGLLAVVSETDTRGESTIRWKIGCSSSSGTG
jgi:serine/threonine protein kinase